MYVFYNPNPEAARVGDCAVRAICRATGRDWRRVYMDLCTLGLTRGDMPNANAVWGAYLTRLGYKRRIIPETADGVTVASFARDNPEGVYILALNGHVVTVEGGDWYDTWNSGGETPIYYWRR